MRQEYGSDPRMTCRLRFSTVDKINEMRLEIFNESEIWLEDWDAVINFVLTTLLDKKNQCK